MSYLEELLPEFRKGAKIRMNCWPKEEYICLKDCDIVDEDGCCRHDELNHISNWFLNGNWEIYQEPINWDYIIKNKCLCWFWDEWFGAACIGILGKINEECDLSYVLLDENGNQRPFRSCRPVRRDEVTFYEDKDSD